VSRSKRVSVPEEQRTKIEERHAAELTALAEHAASAERLALVESRRAEVLAEQDQRVEEARAGRLAAAVSLAELIGVDRAADLTGLRAVELRRCTREAK